MKKSALILFIIIALTAIVACQTEETPGIVQGDYASRVSNFNNFGYMVEYQDQIYFTYLDTDNLDLEHVPNNFADVADFGIYKMDLSGENIEKIADAYGRFLQISGDKLYFNTWIPDAGIYRMNLDGSDLELMVEGAWLSFGVYDNMIYYVKDMYASLKKFNTLTGETAIVIDEFCNIEWIDDGFMYFSYEGRQNCSRYDLNTGEIQDIKKEGEPLPHRFGFDGTAAYYSTNDDIHKILFNKNTTFQDEIIADDIDGGYNLLLNGDYIFYFDTERVSEEKLVFNMYRVDKNGENRTLLCSSIPRNARMFVAGTNLYVTYPMPGNAIVIQYNKLNFETSELVPMEIQ
jgi:hypothetical protein